MKILCVFGQHNYGDPSRGQGYEYANFIPALHRLGHDVLFLDSWNRKCFHNFKELNKALLLKVEQNRPDVILSVLFYYEIWRETWEILRDAGISATINWATDDSWKYTQFSKLIAPAFHSFTTTYPNIYSRYQKDGFDHVLLTQWAANVNLLQPPLPASHCLYPVSFVGTANEERKKWVNKLRKRGIDVACFGHGWPHGSINANDISRIMRASVISLNFVSSKVTWHNVKPSFTKQIKARTFEVPGAGGFLLTEWTRGLEQYYHLGKEIIAFRTMDELVSKINYYLTNPTERDYIALAGYERTRREHTYDRRLAEVLEFSLSMRDKYFLKKSVLCSSRIDWGKFEEAVRHHTMNRKLLYLKHTLIKLCSALWGPVRGPRAARRIIFEISWRLVGSHTYSADGLPGRMFYEES